MPDWLGTDTISPQAKHRALPPFSIACRWARDTGIETFDEWNEVAKLGWLPFGIPTSPASSYEKEWKSWSDFLGTGKHVTGESYRSFKDARKFARSLKLESSTAWVKHWKTHKIPHDIPLSPDQAYRGKGWKIWSDFLGNRSKQGGWWPYERAREHMISLHLKNIDGFMKLRDEGKIPDDIPLDPAAHYNSARTWKGWYDFLGKEDVRVTVTNLQKFVKSLLDSKLLDGNVPAGFNYSLMMKNKNLNLNTITNRKLIRTLVDLSETPTGRKNPSRNCRWEL